MTDKERTVLMESLQKTMRRQERATLIWDCLLVATVVSVTTAFIVLIGGIQ